MKTIAIVNQKGGVAKTTTAIHLASGLAHKGREVLLIDLDPQGHAGSGLGVNVHELERTVSDLLLRKDVALAEVVVPTGIPRLRLVPANLRLAAGSVELGGRIGSERTLLRKLQGVDDDYVLIDCPPSLGTLTVIGLTASDSVLIPTQMGHFSTEGIADLLDTLDLIRENLEKDLEILGVLPTMVDGRNRTVNRRVMAELEDYFGGRVFETAIAKNLEIEKAQARGRTVYDWSPKSSGARTYRAFVEEFLRRVER